MATISLAMIVKNEEGHLEECLNSVKEIVDEMIIVDTGSGDQTKSIAEKYTDRVFDFEWMDDFSTARNEAFSKATKDFILWLDADDRLLEADQKKLKQLKRQLDESVDAVSMIYNTGTDAEGKVTFSFRRNRLVKRSRGFRWTGRVHECLEVGGNIIESDINVMHAGKKSRSNPDRNLKIYEKMLDDGIPFTPRDFYYYANECYDHKHYETAVDYYEKFLQTEKGWSEDCIAACAKLSDIYLTQGDSKQSVNYCLKSFSYDTPRAEHCCRLGAIYLSNNELNKAIFWYELAAGLDIEAAKKKGGFLNHSYYTWLPHVQLCVCYDRLKKYTLAKLHNDKAKKYDPSNPYVKYNDQYFKSMGI